MVGGRPPVKVPAASKRGAPHPAKIRSPHGKEAAPSIGAASPSVNRYAASCIASAGAVSVCGCNPCR